ncbi:MAG: Sigma-54 dependent transcriptional regulator, Fis family [Myxococcales bacterium]|nr:Sigma-54 dependent transcriptional regulator, Fis family [Myxococcales bacterium]
MPSLRVTLPGKGPKVYHLYKKITSIGSGEENDISLPDPLLADTHAHIHFDGRDFNITSIDKHGDLHVNGKKRKKHRMIHQDTLKIGATDLTFSLYDEPPTDEEAAKTMEALNSYRKLFEFSERLLLNYDLTELLDALMDAVVAITNADKGFLILLEGNELRVKVARNLKRENLADALQQLSDSIVEKVIKTKKAVIVSDALHDQEFSNAMSVMSLKLSSVMCVPLLERGNLLGAIYVGNDSVAQLFDESHLEVLTIFAAQASLIIRNALLVNELKLDNKLLSEQIEAMRFGDIIGSCAAMQEVFKKVQKVATTDISVLITGETGTGKELIARELHRRSGRAKGPFVTINCGAIPENLLESELFGHVKGAFTGAVATKPGKFHSADRGTIFLDEIGEMPLNLQVKLLRVLQEKVVVRVGENRPEPVDIRVLTATNRTLEEEIKHNRFREDLYYRLNVVNIHLPPLRDRGEDVMVIAKYLLHRYSAEFGGLVKGLSPNAVIAIRKFGWPGNIRQLENHIKKACVLADKALLGPEDMGLTADVLPAILPLADAKDKFQREYINQVLELNNGNRTKTARDLGVDPRTIFRHLEKEDDGSGSSDAGEEEPPLA